MKSCSKICVLKLNIPKHFFEGVFSKGDIHHGDKTLRAEYRTNKLKPHMASAELTQIADEYNDRLPGTTCTYLLRI